MMFYNGFNLMIDVILIAVTFVIAHGIGYRKAFYVSIGYKKNRQVK